MGPQRHCRGDGARGLHGYHLHVVPSVYSIADGGQCRDKEVGLLKKHGGFFDKEGVAHNSAWFAKESKRRRAKEKAAKKARKKGRNK